MRHFIQIVNEADLPLIINFWDFEKHQVIVSPHIRLEKHYN